MFNVYKFLMQRDEINYEGHNLDRRMFSPWLQPKEHLLNAMGPSNVLRALGTKGTSASRL